MGRHFNVSLVCSKISPGPTLNFAKPLFVMANTNFKRLYPALLVNQGFVQFLDMFFLKAKLYL